MPRLPCLQSATAPCKPGRPLSGLLLGLALSTAVIAAEVHDVSVTHHDGRYRIFMRVDIAANPQRAMDVFTDYQNLTLINPAVKEVQILASKDDYSQIRTRIEICVLWVCKDVVQVQDMRREGLRLKARVVAAQSDLRYGKAKWHVWECRSSEAERACLTLHAELEPDFWVPPLIGPYVMKRMLAEEALITSRGIERLAQTQ